MYAMSAVMSAVMSAKGSLNVLLHAHDYVGSKKEQKYCLQGSHVLLSPPKLDNMPREFFDNDGDDWGFM